MSNHEELASTLASIEKIQTATNELIAVTKAALETPNINEKTIQRNFVELCTGLVEKVCEDLSKEDATTILCEQISAIQGVKGKQLAELLSSKLKQLDSDT